MSVGLVKHTGNVKVEVLTGCSVVVVIVVVVQRRIHPDLDLLLQHVLHARVSHRPINF